ncbi:HIT family protein [Streptomyces sp. NPDC053720]|uniref:HIT family protein n=1 Tax=Streptomyces sp. NPDC053720 TaxID=3154855 RepID=UPI0034310EA1
MATQRACTFCLIADGQAPAVVVRRWEDRGILAILPLNPVTDGHVLVLPAAHVEDAGADQDLAARTMACASELLADHDAGNIITSKGEAATQSVGHLHLHVIPRRRGDDLPLPWTPQQAPADT